MILANIGSKNYLEAMVEVKTEMERLVEKLKIDIFDVCNHLGLKQSEVRGRISGNSEFSAKCEQMFKRFLAKQILENEYPVTVGYADGPLGAQNTVRNEEFQNMRSAIKWLGNNPSFSVIGIYVQLEDLYEIYYSTESMSETDLLERILS